jgi:hypothetical protein
MTMGFKDDGDPPTGNPGVGEDKVEDGMDMEETTVPVVRKSMEKSGSRTSLSRFANTSSKQYKDKDDVKDKDKIVDDDERIGMEAGARQSMEKLASVAGQSMAKSRNNSLQKKASRSATTTRMMMRSNGHATRSVDDDERVQVQTQGR